MHKKYVFICGSAVLSFMEKEITTDSDGPTPLGSIPVYQDEQLCKPNECGLMPEEDYQFLLLVRDYKEKHDDGRHDL